MQTVTVRFEAPEVLSDGEFRELIDDIGIDRVVRIKFDTQNPRKYLLELTRNPIESQVKTC
jgi:hypothetical protein